MQTCFKKLWDFMEGYGACVPALIAVDNASNWDALCAHPCAAEWAKWALARLDHFALLQYKEALYKAWDNYSLACKERHASDEDAFAITHQARQAYRRCAAAYDQAAIEAVRKHFESPEK